MVLTYKNKFNNYYDFQKDTTHSVEDISKITGYNLKGLKKKLSKGEDAYYSNHASVIPPVHSATQWGLARVYNAVMGGNASIVDAGHLYYYNNYNMI